MHENKLDRRAALAVERKSSQSTLAHRQIQIGVGQDDRRVLGLEAKNPAIILSDADLDLAVRECTLGTLSFNGQRCTAIKLIFVHRSLFEPFSQRFADAVGRLKVGMPWEEGVQITPLPEEGKPQWLKELVEEAV